MKTKKTRTIKNGLINIDDVYVEAGLNYANWIGICRDKLQQREEKLLTVRLQKCDEIIRTSIQQFGKQNTETFDEHKSSVHIYVNRMDLENYQAYNQATRAFSTILNNYNQSVVKELLIWKGYTPQKHKSKIQTFRQYFTEARRWFDVKKMKLLAEYFLVSISRIINQFVEHAAKEFFANHCFHLQKLYATYLNKLILNNLFQLTMQLPNTRSLYVIPAQTYLMITRENCKISYSLNKTHNTQSKETRNTMVESLTKECNVDKSEFESELLSLHYEVDNYKFESPPQNINNINYLSSTQIANNYNQHVQQNDKVTSTSNTDYKNSHNIAYQQNI